MTTRRITPGKTTPDEVAQDESVVRDADDDQTAPAKSDKARQAQIDKLRDLQIAEATERAADRTTKRMSKLQQAKAYQASLKIDREQAEQRAEACTHRKGGKVGLAGGMEALTQGNDQNYSVIKHTLPLGETIVICQRCPMKWRKPDEALKKSNPAEYKQQLKTYQWALRLPTDNEPSGTQLFLRQRAAA